MAYKSLLNNNTRIYCSNKKSYPNTHNPSAYDFIIGGFIAVKKLAVKEFMAEFTCKAIALAALATGPKNILTRIVLI